MSLADLFSLILSCITGVFFSDRFFLSRFRAELVGHKGVQTLDKDLIPTSSNHRRLLFIGDVHGCLDELKLLLKKCEFDPHRDHIILVGDLVAKGPFSLDTITFIDDLNQSASCVRGNHDVKLIRWRAYLSGKSTLEDDLSEESLPDGLTRRDEHRFLAKNLDADQVNYLESLPYILRVPMPTQEFLVVHAGLIPKKALHKQKCWDVCNMRNIKGKKALERRDQGGRGWFDKWEKAQLKLKKSERQVVIYGHDAGRGLNLKEYSKGLDSRCVRGGTLTAMIMTAKGESYVHVDAKRRYD